MKKTKFYPQKEEIYKFAIFDTTDKYAILCKENFKSYKEAKKESLNITEKEHKATLVVKIK